MSISASAVSSLSLTYASGGDWSVFTAANLATAGNLQANWTDITSQIGNGYVTAINSCISELTALKSASSIVYYCNAASGSDTNAGTSAGAAFASVQTAVNKLPQILNHSATINLASGTFNEGVSILGFYGSGNILLQGGSSYTNAGNYIVSNMSIRNNVVEIQVKGVYAAATATPGFLSYRSIEVLFQDCSVTATTTTIDGFAISNGGFSYITSCESNNRNYGIYAINGAIIFSNNNTGASNDYGLAAQRTATIGKNGTQTSGTTASSYSDTGGEIRT